MKHFLLSILILLATSPGWAKPQTAGPNSQTATAYTTTIRFPISDTADSDPIGVSGACSAVFVVAGSDAVSLYAVPLSTTAAASGTLLNAFTASTTTTPYTFTPGTSWVKAVSTTATTGGSTLTIRCSPVVGVTDGDKGDVTVTAAGTTWTVEGATQRVPSAGETSERYRGTIVDPAGVVFGHGVGYGFASGGNAFTSETYPGSGSNVVESNNLIGTYYNANPCHSVRILMFEHAFEDCYELSYRSTAGTSSKTWVEQNIDVTAPDITVGFTGITGAPVVGNYVTFSGGGTCKVLAWSSPNLTCRMSYGTTAVAQTATWIGGGGGGTVSSVAAFNDASTSWRARQFMWDTVAMQAHHEFYTDASYSYPTVMMRGGTVRMGTTDFPQAVLLLGNTPWSDSLQTIGPAIIGYGGVKLSPGTADDGTITLTGAGTGTDEALKFDFNVSNVVTVTSTTGVTTINFPDASIPEVDIAGGAGMIASGAEALATALITSTNCSTADTALTATGVVATDTLTWSFNADVTAVTGYAPVTTGALSIYAYPSTNAVNFKICNPTASSITPGAVTLNWTVVR